MTRRDTTARSSATDLAAHLFPWLDDAELRYVAIIAGAADAGSEDAGGPRLTTARRRLPPTPTPATAGVELGGSRPDRSERL